MIRLILTLWSIVLFAYATLPPALLQIEAKLYPKIIFLDQNASTKLIDNKIVLYLLVQPKYLSSAQELQNLLQKERVYGHAIEAKIFFHLPKKRPTAYILIADPSYISTHFSPLPPNRITFSAIPQAITKSMISIKIGTKIYPYINAHALKTTAIHFNPILFKVAKIYE